jgi:hypothetical protein
MNDIADSLSSKFKIYDEKKKKKLFKTKLLNKDFVTCDICGERLKIGTLSLYSAQFNLRGHPDHVIDFIQTNLKK